MHGKEKYQMQTVSGKSKMPVKGGTATGELLQQCINDIREVLEGGFPNDLVEYINSSRTAGSDADLS